MFAAVTHRETAHHAARRAGWLLGSTVLQGGLVAAIVALGFAARPPDDEPVVPIVFPTRPEPPRERRPSVPDARPRERPPAAPSDLVQPRDIAPSATLEPGPPDPAPSGPVEVDPGFLPGTGPSGPAAAGAVEDVVFAGAGYRAPAMATRGCVQRSVRVPRDLAGFASGTVVVKFAVGRDGTPGRFSVEGGEVPDRLAAAIRQAVEGCRWIAGADPAGQPTSIWVVMPLRFSPE